MAKKENAGGRVEIGVVGRPHGVAGSFHVFLHNPSSDILERVEWVDAAADSAGPAVAHRVAAVRRAGKGYIVAFEGFDRREQAATLTGARLLVPRSALPALPDGEFYVADLIGLEVFESGRRLGVVASSRAQGGIEILQVADDESELDVPLVADFVIAVDLDAARIEVADTGELPRTARRARSEERV